MFVPGTCRGGVGACVLLSVDSLSLPFEGEGTCVVDLRVLIGWLDCI